VLGPHEGACNTNDEVLLSERNRSIVTEPMLDEKQDKVAPGKRLHCMERSDNYQLVPRDVGDIIRRISRCLIRLALVTVCYDRYMTWTLWERVFNLLNEPRILVSRSLREWVKEDSQ
jgi:hypothetical protein